MRWDNDRPLAVDFRLRVRPEHGQHLLPDDDRPVALLRRDARDQPRPVALLHGRRLHHLYAQSGDRQPLDRLSGGHRPRRARRAGGRAGGGVARLHAGGGGVVKYFWGLVPRPVAIPIDAQIFVLGTEIPVYRLVVVGIAGLVYGGIWLFLNKTIVGKAIRAGIENVEHVEGLGINVSRLFTLIFIIAGALSGLAGGLHAPLIMVEPQMGLEVLAFAFMVVIIGGLGSIKGTLVSPP